MKDHDPPAAATTPTLLAHSRLSVPSIRGGNSADPRSRTPGADCLILLRLVREQAWEESDFLPHFLHTAPSFLFFIFPSRRSLRGETRQGAP